MVLPFSSLSLIKLGNCISVPNILVRLTFVEALSINSIFFGGVPGFHLMWKNDDSVDHDSIIAGHNRDDHQPNYKIQCL